MIKKSDKYVYIVVSGTNTVLGKVIQKGLDVSYNHCSISLDENLDKIYSFGRKRHQRMLPAGFVHESKNSGFFKKYWQSRIIVLKIAITEIQWTNITNTISMFEEEENRYKYSSLGLIYCYLGIAVKRKNKYFCSQFVTEVLNLSGVSLFEKSETLVRPHDFLKLPQSKIIYSGEIGAYAAT